MFNKIINVINCKLMSQGKMIKTLNLMPGVSLALALLIEMYKEDSFWKPYMGWYPISAAFQLAINAAEQCLRLSNCYDSFIRYAAQRI